MAAAKGRENFHGTLWNTMQCRYTCSCLHWNDVSKRPSASFRLSWKRHWQRNFTRSYRVIFDVGRTEQFLDFQNTLKGRYFLLPQGEIFPPFAAGSLRISLCPLIFVRPSRPYRTRSTLHTIMLQSAYVLYEITTISVLERRFHSYRIRNTRDSVPIVPFSSYVHYVARAVFGVFWETVLWIRWYFVLE